MNGRPPRAFWLIPALVALLRAMPFLATRLTTPPAGSVNLPIGYIPKDWFQYVAFIRATASSGDWFTGNPFTTAVQTDRFLLLLLDVCGFVSRWTGIDPFLVLELSRIPLIFLFFLALWRLTGVVLDKGRHRVLACALVGFSGGVEALVDFFFARLPSAIQPTVQQDLWHLQGWSTFAAAYNPIWVAALALTVWILAPMLRPGGPHGVRDYATLAVGVVLLGWTHPYSAIVVLAVALARPILGWVVGSRTAFEGVARTWIAMAPALVLLAAVAAWQRDDVVYRETSSHVLGPQDLSIFWYPVTLGAVGYFALRGWLAQHAELDRSRLALGAWSMTVIALHTSPVLNGYHFVFHLHLPLCLAAAPALADTLDRARVKPSGWVLRPLILVLLFQAPIAMTKKCIDEAAAHRLPLGIVETLSALEGLPPGNVLAPAELGNYIPAYTPHRVYVGHWFLTQDYPKKAQEVVRILTGQATPEAVTKILDTQRIRYVVAPPQFVPKLETAAGSRLERTLEAGDYSIVILRDAGA